MPAFFDSDSASVVGRESAVPAEVDVQLAAFLQEQTILLQAAFLQEPKVRRVIRQRRIPLRELAECFYRRQKE